MVRVLTALAATLLLLGGAFTGLGVMRTYTSDELTSAVTVAPNTELQADVLVDQPRGQTRADVRVDVVETDNTLVRTVVMLVDTLNALLVGAGLLFALGVLRSTSKEGAFVESNVKRIRMVGWCSLGYFGVSVLLAPVVTVWAQDRLGSDGSFVAVSFAPGLAALAVFALAQVWGRGVELEELEAATV